MAIHGSSYRDKMAVLLPSFWAFPLRNATVVAGYCRVEGSHLEFALQVASQMRKKRLGHCRLDLFFFGT